MNDYMAIKIIVDCRVVYEDEHTYQVSFDYNMEFGYYTVHVVTLNPTYFRLDPTILVMGRISLLFL